MESKIKQLFEYISFLKERRESGDQDLSSKDITELNLISNNQNFNTFFDNTIRQNAYLNTRNDRILELILDLQSSVRTMDDQISNITNPDAMDNETISRLLEQFGFYNHYLMSTDVKKRFIFDLASLYKAKGTPETLKTIINYVFFLNAEIVEYWLLKDRYTGRLFFRGYPVSQSDTAQNIGTVIKEYEEVVDVFWRYEKSQIESIDAITPRGLPSMSPYFTLAIDLDLGAMTKGINFLSSESVKLMDIYSSGDLEEYNKYKIWSVGQEQKFFITPLEALLGACYMYNKKYDRNLPVTVDEKVYTWIRQNPNDDGAEFLSDYSTFFESNLIDYNKSDKPLSAVQNITTTVNDTYSITNFLVETEYRKQNDFSLNVKNYAHYNYGNRTIICGGDYINGSGVSDEIYFYDITRDTKDVTFNHLPNDPEPEHRYTFLTTMPKKLRRHNVLLSPLSDNIIVLNGIDENEELNKDIFVYSIVDDTWSSYEDSNPQPTIDGSVEFYPSQDKYYDIGNGFSTTNDYVNNRYIIGPGYNPETMEYSNGLFIMDVSTQEVVDNGEIDVSGLSDLGRTHYGLYCTGDEIIIQGGLRASIICNKNYLYNILTESWIEMDPLPQNRFNNKILEINNEIFDVGGWIDRGTTNPVRESITSNFSLNGNKFSDNSFYFNQFVLYGSIYGPTNVKYKFEYEPSYNWSLVENQYTFHVEGQKRYLYNNGVFSQNPSFNPNRTFTMSDTALFIYKHGNSIVFVNPQKLILDNQGNFISIDTQKRINVFEYRKLSPDDISVINEGIVYTVENPSNITGRKQRDTRLKERNQRFAVDNYYLTETNDDNKILLQTLNNSFVQYLDSLIDNESEEFNTVFYQILSTMDNYCFYKGIRSTFRAIFLIGDDSLVPSITEEFKPAHARYSGLSLLYTIKDRIGDKLPIDEYLITIPKLSVEDRLNIREVFHREAKVILADIYQYPYNFDQKYSRLPNIFYDEIVGSLVKVYSIGGDNSIQMFMPIYNDITKIGVSALRTDSINIKDEMKLKLSWSCSLCGEKLIEVDYMDKDFLPDDFKVPTQTDHQNFMMWWSNKRQEAINNHSC